MTVMPFDITYKASDDFSERIARNQQLLLRDESHFGKVTDPAAGSYYICLLYTSDAADDLLCVDLGGRRIIKKKTKNIINNKVSYKYVLQRNTCKRQRHGQQDTSQARHTT